jgi:asparagine N-glycosylation enzyme membrane subunit Stt3
MEYKKDYYGYVYEWTNTTNGMKYIGSHYGAVNDRYAGSGKEFMKAYKKSPESFVMVVLEYVTQDNKKLLLDVEKKWLDTVPDIKDHKGYYNLNNDAVGGFGYINNDHIIKRANTLKEKHKANGPSVKEQESYKQKIESRLKRISKLGFTEKEKLQHSKYGYQVSVTDSVGVTTVYDSCGQASKATGINIQYGLKVCSTKGVDFKGYKIVKLRDPIIDCR